MDLALSWDLHAFLFLSFLLIHFPPFLCKVFEYGFDDSYLTLRLKPTLFHSHSQIPIHTMKLVLAALALSAVGANALVHT